MNNSTTTLTSSLLLGVATGDALGVPFEFYAAERLIDEQFIEMTGYGTHEQPPGTFSDDSSLTFCLVEALIQDLSLEQTAKLFIRWKNDAYWTAGNSTFDIGVTTWDAISRIEKGIAISIAGPRHERSCGNGALMRILPLVFYFSHLNWDEKFELTKKYAQITHGHLRSHIACMILLEIGHRVLMQKKSGVSLLEFSSKRSIFSKACNDLAHFFSGNQNYQIEWQNFPELLDSIKSVDCSLTNSGYVLHSLQATLHAWIHTEDYESCIIKTIRLGGDTDTNAAIAGGLAGLTYGLEAIPERWLKDLLRKDDILDLAHRWAEKL